MRCRLFNVNCLVKSTFANYLAPCSCRLGSCVDIDFTSILQNFRSDLLPFYVNKSLRQDPQFHPLTLSLCGKKFNKFSKKRSILECPNCLKTYQGGYGRISRLLQHAAEKHKDDCPSVLNIIKEKYSQAPSDTSGRGSNCIYCNKFVKGSCTKMQKHITRMHPTAPGLAPAQSTQ
jgi:hypothetical protein